MIYLPIPDKYCPRCKQFKNRDLFYLSSRSTGLSVYCKTCEALRKGKTPRVKDKIPKGHRRCSGCKGIFPETLEFFPPHKTRGKDSFRQLCRPCWRAYQRKYNADHPEVKQASRKRRDPAIVAAEKKRSHERNRDKDNARVQKWVSENLDHARQSARDNYYANREKRIAQAMLNTVKRMARKRSLPDDFTMDDWSRVKDYFEHRCAVCGRAPDFWHVLAMDHWVALADPNCPGTVINNMIPLCHSRKGVPLGDVGCNNSKGKKNALEWLTSRYGLRKAQSIIARIEAYFASLR